MYRWGTASEIALLFISAYRKVCRSNGTYVITISHSKLNNNARLLRDVIWLETKKIIYGKHIWAHNWTSGRQRKQHENIFETRKHTKSTVNENYGEASIPSAVLILITLFRVFDEQLCACQVFRTFSFVYYVEDSAFSKNSNNMKYLLQVASSRVIPIFTRFFPTVLISFYDKK